MSIKVHCDKHRPQRYLRDWSFVECRAGECQELMAKRREAVRAAGAPTEEDKARWRGERRGVAVAKAIPDVGKHT